MVNGERRYVRHTTFTSSEKQDGPIHARFIYDYREYSTPLVVCVLLRAPCSRPSLKAHIRDTYRDMGNDTLVAV